MNLYAQDYTCSRVVLGVGTTSVTIPGGQMMPQFKMDKIESAAL